MKTIRNALIEHFATADYRMAGRTLREILAEGDPEVLRHAVDACILKMGRLLSLEQIETLINWSIQLGKATRSATRANDWLFLLGQLDGLGRLGMVASEEGVHPDIPKNLVNPSSHWQSILAHLQGSSGGLRFTDLKDALGINSNPLSERLKQLIEYRLVLKSGSRYELSPRGYCIAEILLNKNEPCTYAEIVENAADRSSVTDNSVSKNSSSLMFTAMGQVA